MVEHKGKFYVVGGQGHMIKDMIIINQATWEATQVSTPIESQLESHTAVKIENEKGEALMLLYGGFNEEGLNPLMYVYNIDSTKWTKVKIPKEYIRAAHSAIVYNEKIYIFGGQNDNGAKENSTIIYDYKKNKWELLKPNSEPKVYR